MQRWQAERITHPLPAEEQQGVRRMAPDSDTTRQEANDLSELANTPTVTMHVTRPEQDAARPEAPPSRPPQPGPALLTGDEPELRRIREILVGPYLRDHERRLRAIERQAAEPSDSGAPASADTQAIAQMAAELERERAERQLLARGLQMAVDEHQALRAELARERQMREELADRHARAISELAKTLDQERAAHARLHALHAAELDARLERERQAQAEAMEARLHQEQQAHAQTLDTRLERERQAHAEDLRSLQSAHEAQIASLQQLVADAQSALVAMQAERQYLAGLLAELGLHLVRHAASPAAEAERTGKSLLGSIVRRDRPAAN
jgi:hypothetical protein